MKAHSPPKITIGESRSSAPLQGHERTSVAVRAARLRVLWVLALAFPLSCFAARSCDDWHAELVSFEGRVEIRTPAGWQPVAHGSKVCTGDSIRVQGYSRAALRLPDKTVLRLDQHTSVTFSEPQDDTGSWLDVLRGVIHVISRDPRALRFNTPYANAGLEGTEFVIEVSGDQTDVTVLEGEVVLSNTAGAVEVISGQRGSARRAELPTSLAIPDAVSAVRWTPYQMPILDEPLPDPDQEPNTEQAKSADFFTLRGARRLAVGRVAEARSDLAQALTILPRHGDAIALQTLVALADKEFAEALSLAQIATQLAPDTPATWLAMSYAAEADFDLEQAYASAAMAAALAPEHGSAQARLAELELARGNNAAAAVTAEKAVALRPDLAHPLTVLGFAQMSGGTSTEAAANFRAAIALDPAAPLPRLGLGLALARQGQLGQGREDIELAVILDPTNALSRSYMAKVYDAERRGALSDTQLALAKDLNAGDPTPWYYGALRKQAENRPVEALHDLQTAIDLNDSRAVYRSRLLVDEDLVARSAGIGKLHTTLGFEQLALLQGWNAVVDAPDDYSGHRLLADVYAYLPRHQIARVSELFQSQLMQPLNVTPIRPQLAEANLFILDTVGPSSLAFDEFQPILRTNGPSFQGSAVTGGNDTRGSDITLTGAHDRVSYSLGHFDFHTAGFRANNDLDQQVTSAFVQFRPRHETSVMTEMRSSRTEKGSLQLLFDKSAFSQTMRQQETVDSLRAGLRRDLSAKSTLLSSIVFDETHTTLSLDDSLFWESPRSGYAIDAQYLRNEGRWHLTAGARHSRERLRNTITSTFMMPFPPFEEESITESTEHVLGYSTAYLYGSVDLNEKLTATLGGSVDRVAGQDIDRSRFNPKLGLTWRTSAGTTFRAVAFRTLQEPFVSKFNIRPSLEPTHVAGFNQQFFGSEGEVAWRYGAAVDHRFSNALYAGLELSRRDLEVPVATVHPDRTTAIRFPGVQETWRRGYVYWTPSRRLSASVTYQYEQFDNGGFAFSDGLTGVRTHRLPVRLNYFHSSGISTGVTVTHIDQAGDFTPMQFGADALPEPGKDRFWVTDLSLSYRLPARRGSVSLNVHNAFDQEFRFQDTDPENPRILPERMVLLKATLSY